MTEAPIRLSSSDMMEVTDYGLADAKAFDQALADNTPYNHEFYTKNKACLLNFVSYYESCKHPNKESSHD